VVRLVDLREVALAQQVAEVEDVVLDLLAGYLRGGGLAHRLVIKLIITL
jgi:hypothetical protein